MANRQVEKLQRMLEEAEGQQQFLAWFTNPMTQQMMLAWQELAQPRPPARLMDGSVDASSAMMELGGSLRCQELLLFTANPLAFAVSEQQMRKRAEALTPRYGARKAGESKDGKKEGERHADQVGS